MMAHSLGKDCWMAFNSLALSLALSSSLHAARVNNAMPAKISFIIPSIHLRRTAARGLNSKAGNQSRRAVIGIWRGIPNLLGGGGAFEAKHLCATKGLRQRPRLLLFGVSSNHG
jgi:hypothetical protein